MLPKLDGLEVCKRLRARSAVPIVMLTARDDELDKVLGLELGADDYITKPFSIREFRSRVRALAAPARRRRARAAGEDVIEVDGLRDRPGAARGRASTVRRCSSPTSSSSCCAPWRAGPAASFSRQALLEAVWGGSDYREPRTIDVHVRHLREKLERDPREPAVHPHRARCRLPLPGARERRVAAASAPGSASRCSSCLAAARCGARLPDRASRRWRAASSTRGSSRSVAARAAGDRAAAAGGPRSADPTSVDGRRRRARNARRASSTTPRRAAAGARRRRRLAASAPATSRPTRSRCARPAAAESPARHGDARRTSAFAEAAVARCRGSARSVLVSSAAAARRAGDVRLVAASGSCSPALLALRRRAGGRLRAARRCSRGGSAGWSAPPSASRAGAFDEPVVDAGGDEVGELARAFDRMRLRLAAARPRAPRVHRQRLARAAHAAVLARRLPRAAATTRSSTTRRAREFLATMREQVERLTKLATDLLDLSRARRGPAARRAGPVDLDELAESGRRGVRAAVARRRPAAALRRRRAARCSRSATSSACCRSAGRWSRTRSCTRRRDTSVRGAPAATGRAARSRTTGRGSRRARRAASSSASTACDGPRALRQRARAGDRPRAGAS